MGGETEILGMIFHGIIRLFTAPWSEIQPYVDRVLALFLMLFAFKILWKKACGK